MNYDYKATKTYTTHKTIYVIDFGLNMLFFIQKVNTATGYSRIIRQYNYASNLKDKHNLYKFTILGYKGRRWDKDNSTFNGLQFFKHV